MTYLDTETPLTARTNDDFIIDVALPFPISTSIPKMKLMNYSDTEIDCSQYIIIDSENSFKIDIKADDVLTLSADVLGGDSSIGFGYTQCNYNVYLDLGQGSKNFLFGGVLTIQEGIS